METGEQSVAVVTVGSRASGTGIIEGLTGGAVLGPPPSTAESKMEGGAHGVQHPRLESASQMAVAAVSVFRDQVCPCVSSFNMPWEHSGSYKDTDAQVEVSCTADSRRG